LRSAKAAVELDLMLGGGDEVLVERREPDGRGQRAQAREEVALLPVERGERGGRIGLRAIQCLVDGETVVEWPGPPGATGARSNTCFG
jgi:hypothetical protein